MIGTRRLLADLAAHVDARHLREHHVEQHEVGLDRVEQVERLGAVRATCTRKPSRLRPTVRASTKDSSSSTTRMVAVGGTHPARLLAGGLADGAGPAGSTRVNVEPSPSWDSTGDVAVVVAGDVADDGQAETGAAGLPAAGPVDPVEALEDPLEVAGRDADALVAHRDLDVRPARDPRRPRMTIGPARSTSSALSSRL